MGGGFSRSVCSLGAELAVLGRTRGPNSSKLLKSTSAPSAAVGALHISILREFLDKALSISKPFLCKHQRVGTWIFWHIFSTPREWDAQFFNHCLHQILVKSFLNSSQIPLLSLTLWPEHLRPLQDIPDRMSSIPNILYLVEGENNKKKMHKNTIKEVQWDGSLL